ncbi:glutathione S-transferase F13-like [Miscanthus floridulus]|uniref:glutathione S-transferase F13-like n=1 Tax=Miscanthus floridulus TaxID=154761 RepID=UPI00345A51D2
MAVKVYGWAISPFVSRVLLCLEEAGVDYELVAMSREAGDHRHHRRPDYLARNPFGEAPVLEDGDLTLFGPTSLVTFLQKEMQKHIQISYSICTDYFVGKYRYDQNEMLPLIVNTPGWVKGAGFDMLIEMLRWLASRT